MKLAIVAVSTALFASAYTARAQAIESFAVESDSGQSNLSWESALYPVHPKGKIDIVTLDQPERRHSCRVQSFTATTIVCSRRVGKPQTFTIQKVLALILPGDGPLILTVWLGSNAALGASIWGTVVLAATCPVCAAGTAVAALFFFDVAGLAAFTGGEPDRLLYLAQGHPLTGKLSSLQP